MVSGSNSSMVLSVTLPDKKGSQKFQDGGGNNVLTVHVYQLIHDSNTISNIITRFYLSIP